MSRCGRNCLFKLHMDWRAIAQRDHSRIGSRARSSFRRRGGRIVQDALSVWLNRLWLRRSGARLVFYEKQALQRNVTDFAFGRAHTEIEIVPSGDLNLLPALECRPHVKSDHRTIKIDVAT